MAYVDKLNVEHLNVVHHGAVRGSNLGVTCAHPMVPSADRTHCRCSPGFFSLSGKGWKDTTCHSCANSGSKLEVSCPGGDVGFSPVLSTTGVFILARALENASATWHACIADELLNKALCGSRPLLGPYLFHCDETLCVGTKSVNTATKRSSVCAGQESAANKSITNCCSTSVKEGSAMCGVCQENFGKVSGKGCIKCTTYDWPVIIGYNFAYAMLGGYFWYKSTTEFEQDNLVDILVTFLQFIALFSKDRISGAAEEAKQSVVALLLGDVSSAGAGSKCVGPFSFLGGFVYGLFPVLAMAIPALILRIVKRNSHHAATQYLVTASKCHVYVYDTVAEGMGDYHARRTYYKQLQDKLDTHPKHTMAQPDSDTVLENGAKPTLNVFGRTGVTVPAHRARSPARICPTSSVAFQTVLDTKKLM